ncbi:hypothetical protein CEF21_07235 [Bacillus sp. FJAT-42376]|uniref:hypothetical protein n=1 Tax=Bacillus sp. FJAT-42376 TaxID=2014076 RepID=UPI000F4F018C|nr:hypothetical protein [Bacillus sp. FJAT-42376]AZB42100.1 hypothetical protein CEF21_07235 [Bacillus sp. FJAT-42376]
MEKRWKHEDRLFETLWEAELWADSIANEMSAKLYDGYSTPDHKVAYVLSFLLASDSGAKIGTEKRSENGSFLYKVWIE